MDEQQSTTSGDLRINQSQHQSAIKITIPIFLLTLSLFISIIVLVFILINGKSKAIKPEIQLTPTIVKDAIKPFPTALNITKTPISSPEAQLNNPLIIYLKDKNIWSVKADGTTLRQLTIDGDQKGIRYTGLTFKNKDNISFAKCLDSENKCAVKTKNIVTSDETEEFNTQNNISFLAWDKNNTVIAYILSSSTSQSLYFYQTDNSKKIFTFETSLGRGGGYGDELALFWSPDDRYLLVVNTGTQPNQKNDKTSIWVFDRFGNILTAIGKDYATKARWVSNTEFIYQAQDKLFKHLVSGSDQEISKLDGYISSVNLNNLLIWKYNDDGTTNIISYSLDQQTSFPAGDNIINPIWYDNNSIIAIKTSPDSNSMFGFGNTALVSYDLKSKKELILDSNPNIYEFMLQPK